MKTFEELEQMTIAQLEGIATSLGVEVPAKIKKAEIVQLVYDIQQPSEEPDTDTDTPAEEPKKDVTTDAEVKTQKATIEEHFGGELIEDGEENGIVLFAVVNEDADVLAQGTFPALYKQAIGEPHTDEDSDELGDVPLSEEPDAASEEIRPEDLVPGLIAAEGLEDTKKALNALRTYGLIYEIEGGVVRLIKGSRVVTTTLNQPAHRVVRTAESLCNFR